MRVCIDTQLTVDSSDQWKDVLNVGKGCPRVNFLMRNIDGLDGKYEIEPIGESLIEELSPFLPSRAIDRALVTSTSSFLSLGLVGRRAKVAWYGKGGNGGISVVQEASGGNFSGLIVRCGDSNFDVGKGYVQGCIGFGLRRLRVNFSE